MMDEQTTAPIDATPEPRPEGADVADRVIALRAYIDSRCKFADDREAVFAATISLLCARESDTLTLSGSASIPDEALKIHQAFVFLFDKWTLDVAMQLMSHVTALMEAGVYHS